MAEPAGRSGGSPSAGRLRDRRRTAQRIDSSRPDAGCQPRAGASRTRSRVLTPSPLRRAVPLIAPGGPPAGTWCRATGVRNDARPRRGGPVASALRIRRAPLAATAGKGARGVAARRRLGCRSTPCLPATSPPYRHAADASCTRRAFTPSASARPGPGGPCSLLGHGRCRVPARRAAAPSAPVDATLLEALAISTLAWDSQSPQATMARPHRMLVESTAGAWPHASDATSLRGASVGRCSCSLPTYLLVFFGPPQRIATPWWPNLVVSLLP